MDPPDGFDEYWAELRAETNAIDTDWDRVDRRQTVVSRGKTWRIDWIRFSSFLDVVVQGWLAVPVDHPATHCGFLWLPGYSYGTPPPDETNLVAGSVTFAINVHGNAPDAPYVNPAGKDDYILDGINDRRTYIYRSIVGHCLCAIDVLSEQPEVTVGVAVGGMSQGGGLALLTAAQDSRLKVCCADMPFLSDLRMALSVSHSPAYKALKSCVDRNPYALETALLFDPLFHASRIDVPVWMSAGGKDPACKPQTVEAVFKRLASRNKHYEFFPTAGHIFLPQMNAAYERLIDAFVTGQVS